jgi:hypothetical protein
MSSKLFSFWDGAPLGYVERLCIASMLEVRHALDIYSYRTDLDIPKGVALCDANDILPRSRVVLHETGSWAPFADIFRYEALLRGAGIWIDLDVLLLKPIGDIGEHVVGWQDAYVINNAVLRLPPASPCLQRLIALGRSEVVVPPQWSSVRRMSQRLRSLFGQHIPFEKLEWGATGPLALTRLIFDLRLLHLCQPVDVFYPVPWQHASHLFQPDATLVESALTSNTRAVHLWNDRIKHLKGKAPPPGSYVAKMCKVFKVDVP